MNLIATEFEKVNVIATEIFFFLIATELITKEFGRKSFEST